METKERERAYWAAICNGERDKKRKRRKGEEAGR